MRLTIERLRTLVLVAGVLLVIALGVFLGTARFRNRFIRKDLPQKLGLNIQEEANGLVVTHEVRGHMLYKIRASKQIQLKRDGKVFLQLHDVNIELYAEDGSRVDRIAGDDFEYDPKSGIARALGPVEITLMKPTVAPAIAPRVSADKAINPREKNNALVSAAHSAASGEIQVKTSGLIFDRDTGKASTEEKVEFALSEGSGSAIGANFDAHDGKLVLDRAVELRVKRGVDPVSIAAKHAVFERDNQVCELTGALMRYRNDEANAASARIYFRDDGSAEHIQANDGFHLDTAKGGRLNAPMGTLNFDEHNQPERGHLQGGVTIDYSNNGRAMHGASPIMDLAFASQGVLRSVHLERGVEITSDDDTLSARGPLRTHRVWKSPVADVAFRNAGKGRVELASIHGIGGVSVAATSQRGNSAATPENLTAEEVTGDFDTKGALTKLIGKGNTSISETTASGTLETMSGDSLEAHMASAANAKQDKRGEAGADVRIETATVDGNVVLTEQPPAKAGVKQTAMRATAGHAEYESAGQWLRLTKGPRVTDGGLELTAEKLNVSQDSGDAVAKGNVKATWAGEAAGSKRDRVGAPSVSPNFGAQGPTHVVAENAELKHSSGSATFRGNVRLWQQGNSVNAPVIVLDRTKQTLQAQTTSAKSPVQVVMVSASGIAPGADTSPRQKDSSVISVTGGDLKYSNAERTAVMRSGIVGRVISSSAGSTTQSDEVELTLLPPGNHAGKEGAAAQVDRMISMGHVEISSEGRHGSGEKLVYTSDSGNYVLTGTPAVPPLLSDSTHGTITGQALIFNSRDDSVSIEGEGRKTTTITTAPK